MTIEGDCGSSRTSRRSIWGAWPGAASSCATSAVVEAAHHKPILFFPARHDHWLVQTGDGWAAHVAGAIGVSTDAQASWWGGRGVGTVPHALIAAYRATPSRPRARSAAATARDERHVLVDFDNDSVGTSLAVAEALGDGSGACAWTPPSGSWTTR